jgi:NADH-quinone oxidoreductase subunit G
VIEGPREINRHSVISQGHYAGKIGTTQPKETFTAVHDGRQPKLLMDIHSVSEVNRPNIELSLINGPAHSADFNKKND